MNRITIAAAALAVALSAGSAGAQSTTKYFARQHLGDLSANGSTGSGQEDPNVARPADTTQKWPQMTSSATAPQIAARFAAIQADVIDRKAK